MALNFDKSASAPLSFPRQGHYYHCIHDGGFVWQISKFFFLFGRKGFALKTSKHTQKSECWKPFYPVQSFVVLGNELMKHRREQNISRPHPFLSLYVLDTILSICSWGMGVNPFCTVVMPSLSSLFVNFFFSICLILPPLSLSLSSSLQRRSSNAQEELTCTRRSKRQQKKWQLWCHGCHLAIMQAHASDSICSWPAVVNLIYTPGRPVEFKTLPQPRVLGAWH